MLFPLALCAQGVAAESIQISGFFSTGVTNVDKENIVLTAKNIERKTNYLADTVFGLQLDSLLSNEARFSAQLVAKDKSNSFNLEAEWLFISYQLSQNYELRAGRLRIPLFLTSETILVGQSYNWVRPPLELYTLDSGLSQYNGFSTIHSVVLGQASIETEFYIGQTVGEIDLGFVADFSSDHLYGVQFSYSTDNLIIRASRSEFTASVEGTLSIEDIEIQILQVTSASFSILGASYRSGNWGVISEIGRMETENQGQTTAYYLTISHNFNRLMPLFTYGANKTSSSFASHKGDSLSLGVKYNFNETASMKTEVLYGELLDGRSLLLGTSLKSDFDEKVTMYSMTLNLIF
ncbi:MAG: hypothetical protein KUG82_01510 [Pseudomonadales bacterium]|nr:hypothetical protein [Pseudomonadales bacterium]